MGIKYVVRYAHRSPSTGGYINNETVDALAPRMDPAELDAAIAKGFIVPQVTPDTPAEDAAPPQVFGEGITGASRVDGRPVNLLAPSLEDTATWRAHPPPALPFSLEDQGGHPRRRASDFAQVPQDTQTEGGR